MNIDPICTGVIGCGNVANAYFAGARHYHALEITACADRDLERAKAKGAEHGVPAITLDEMLADPSIGLILNLTVPNAHAQIDRAALESGKHVFSEKPLALGCSEARLVLELATQRELRVACAVDTMLGGGQQTCRKLIDEGVIGRPIGAAAFFACSGHEAWHPSPEFYYRKGGGPLFDMGPYYIGALCLLLGPVCRVSAAQTRAFETRAITSEPHFGSLMKVDVPTHVSALLEFESGVAAPLIMSFDVARHSLPQLEIYGTEGVLSVPDPNSFGGPVRVSKRGGRDWEELPLSHEEGMRGAGAADLVHALATGRPHRLTGELAFHVLEIMESVARAGDEHSMIEIKSRVERPAAVPTGLPRGEFE